MITMYRLDLETLEIKPFDISYSTPKSIIKADGERERIEGRFYSWHMSKEAAIAALKDDAMNEIKKAEKELGFAQDYLQQVNALYPDA